VSLPVASPRSLAEALEALADATPDTRVLAGGTDLMVELQIGRTHPDRVVDVWRVDELRGIEAEEIGVRVGALTTCAELLRSDLVPEILAAAADEVGAEQIQNRATVGGNLATASPAADLTPVLLALAATVRLVSARGPRDVPLEAFLTGYRETARAPDELIESVWIPPRMDGERRAFRKLGTRRAQSISKVVVALAVCVGADGVLGDVRAAAGSVAARTVLLPALGRELAGRPPTAEAIERAARFATTHDCAPIDDVRSTADYRRQALYRVLRSMLIDLCLTDDES
jgi:CO/xanthine dehydrogenase FAD-binding subunit